MIYLISSLQTSFVCLGVLLHFRYEDAAAALEAAQHGEVQDLVACRPRQHHRPGTSLRRTRDVQQSQLASHPLQYIAVTSSTNIPSSTTGFVRHHWEINSAFIRNPVTHI